MMTKAALRGIIVFATLVTGSAWAGLTDGLVGYYPCDGNASDESGYANNATPYGAITTADRLGLPHRAYSFDGSSNYLNASDAGMLSFNAQTQNYSVAMWFMSANSSSAHKTLIVDRDGITNPPTSYELYLEDGRLKGNLWDGVAGGNHGYTVVGPPVATGVWHHAAYVISNKMQRLYLDGSLVGTNAIGTLGSTKNTDGTSIGRWSGDFYAFYFQGSLDDIRIYDRALSADEISRLAAGVIAKRIPVFNTGMATLTNRISAGQADPHYFVASNPGGATHGTVAYYYGAPWTANTATSQWISITNCQIGRYIVRTTFELTAPDHSTASNALYLRVASDNDLTNAYLNGSPLGMSSSSFVFGALRAVTSGFVKGVNTIDFHVDSSGCPFGFHAQVWGISEYTASSNAAPPFMDVSFGRAYPIATEVGHVYHLEGRDTPFTNVWNAIGDAITGSGGVEYGFERGDGPVFLPARRWVDGTDTVSEIYNFGVQCVVVGHSSALGDTYDLQRAPGPLSNWSAGDGSRTGSASRIDYLVWPTNTLEVFRAYGPAMSWSAASPTGMTLIPEGAFAMGNATNALPPDPDAGADEVPQHSVYVNAFYLDKFEATEALWDDVATWAIAHGYDLHPVGAAGKGANYPVTGVNWHDVAKWCNARSERDGLVACYQSDGAVYRTGTNDLVTCYWGGSGYRLPTEAEWEKACRGDVAGTRFPWSDFTNNISHARANYYGNGAGYDLSLGYHPSYTNGVEPFTSPVGSFPPNGYGLFDMAGNVTELTWDWYADGYYASSPATDPRGPFSSTTAKERVVRGGGWNGFGFQARCSDRNSIAVASRTDSIGFRCAKGL